METKDRIHQIMDDLQMSQQDFAARLGISPASLSSIFTGRTKPTNNHVQAIHKAFPEININWLLFGEGDIKSDVIKSVTSGSVSELSAAVPSAVSPELGLLFSEPITEAVNRKESPVYPQKSKIEQIGTVNLLDKKLRKVREIRVFYDDGTYESFVPSSK